jgi:hypothetical protein
MVDLAKLRFYGIRCIIDIVQQTLKSIDLAPSSSGRPWIRNDADFSNLAQAQITGGKGAIV